MIPLLSTQHEVSAKSFKESLPGRQEVKSPGKKGCRWAEKDSPHRLTVIKILKICI